MTAARTTLTSRRWSESLRWGSCFALALSFHAAGAAALLARWSEDSDVIGGAPVIMIELVPIMGAPDTTPTELPPGPLQSESEPGSQPETLIEKIELLPDPQAEPDLPVIPPPKPVERPKEKEPKQKHASLASAPSTTERKADRPTPGSTTHNSNANANWMSQLVAQLERNKRYPQEAQSRGDRGTVIVSFSVDRGGGVHHTRVVRGSGSSLLDRDALDWVERSQPLPPPPPDMSGALIPITVPLRYNFR